VSLGRSLASCEAAGVFKPKARLGEPWDNVNRFAGAAERRCRPLCGLHSSRWQVSQGSQSLALGLGTIAASQLVESIEPGVRPAILQFSPGLVSWKHKKVEIAELQA
jgi:hypothetical protein